MIRFASVCAIALVTMSLGVPAGFAQNKNNNKANAAQEKRDDQKIANEKKDVKEAQDKLKTDQKELQDAQKALVDAEGREKAALQKMNETRKRMQAKAEQGSGIDKAMAEQEAAKIIYDEAAAPILKALKETKEYQAAAKTVENARARLKTLKDDTTLSVEAKRKEIGQSSRDALATSELEQKALDSDSSAKSARTKLADAQDRVNQIRLKIRNTIDANPEIKSAVKTMQAAAEDSETASRKVQRIRDKLGSDQAKLVREQQQVQQAEAQDKANDKKAAPKKKRGKN